jgi:hypothetical protein
MLGEHSIDVVLLATDLKSSNWDAAVGAIVEHTGH